MSSFVHLLQRELHSLALARLVAVAAVVVGAWGATRTMGAAATWLIRHSERGVRRLERRKQEETAISIVRTSVRYLAWALALVLSFIVVFGRPGTNTLVGASFLAIIVGFAVQRFLIDLVAGAVMFFEGWLQIGDQVKVEPWDVQGMVEEVSLRALVVRGAGGELQRVHNSQVLALKVFPRGYREAEISLVVRDAERACRIYQELVQWLPVDATKFVRSPEIVEVDELPEGLAMLRLRATVVPGREWMAQSLLPSLLRERAGEDLIVHGPIVSFVDEVAERRFGRLATVAAARADRRNGPRRGTLARFR